MKEIETYLKQELKQEVLLQDLILQVQKDLQTVVDSTIELKAKTPMELIQELYEILQDVLASSNVSRFSNLLYRVDVSEKQIKSIVASDLDQYVQAVVFLILKREFQKVYIKKTY